MKARAAVVSLLVMLVVLSMPRVARAQDAALRACLLLRTPAQCGVGNPAPFTAPGDMQSLRVLRPDPMMRAERESKEPDKFTPLRADVGAETQVEKHRQIVSVPLAWNPFRKASLTADVPVVAQALTSVVDYGIGDVAFGANARGATGIVSGRLVASGKLPTGDASKGTGSGEFDGFFLGEGWLAAGRFSSAASAAFRKNGRVDQADVAQGSLALQYEVPITAMADVACQARAFGHQLTGPSSERSLYLALGVEPRIIGIAVGYAYVLIPVVDDSPFSTGVTAAAGVILPFGDKPSRPFVDTKEPAQPAEPRPMPSMTPPETKPEEAKPEEARPEEPKPEGPKPEEPKPEDPKPDAPKPDEPKPEPAPPGP